MLHNANNSIESSNKSSVAVTAEISLQHTHSMAMATSEQWLQSEGKKICSKEMEKGMEVYYLCQPNTYVIAHAFGEQQ